MRVNGNVTKLATFVLVMPAFITVISVAEAQTVPMTDVALPMTDVAQRQDGMKAMANAAKVINAMFKDMSPYKAKLFKSAEETIRTHSGATLSSLFKGSDITIGSKASPSIQTDRHQFDKLASDLGIYASALSVAADRNPDSLGPGMRMLTGDAMGGGPLARKVDAARDAASTPAEHAFHMMLQTCTSCHAKFRVKAD